MKLKGFGISIMILLAGCSDTRQMFHEKKVLYPSNTRIGVPYINNHENLSRMAWWSKLNDPTLNRLILCALKNNNSVKRAKATIEQAEFQLKAAQYAWLPTLDASMHAFSTQTWDTHARPNGVFAQTPLLSNMAPIKFRGYYAGFVPGYSVNILNNMANIHSAKASLAIEQAQTQATKLSLISQVSGAYFMLLSQKEQLKVENYLIHHLKTLRNLEKIRYQKGASDIETVTSLDQQINQEETKPPQIKAVVVKTENTLHVLLDQNPGPIHTQRDIFALNPDKLVPKHLPSSVLKTRPDIMMAINQVKLAYAQLNLSYSVFFPTLTLTNTDGSASINLSHLLRLTTGFWLNEAAANAKLLNFSAYQSIKAAKAALHATYFDYVNTLRTVFSDVDTTLSNEKNNRLSYLKAQKSYHAAKQTYRLAMTQYKKGAKDYRTALNAQINLDQALLNFIQIKAQLLDSMVQVYTAVGGGYNTADY